MDMWILLVVTSIAGVAGTVEVHFENKDGGFFLRHSSRGQAQSLPDPGTLGPQFREGPTDGSTVLSVDRFTVLQTSQPTSVRATYGPFSTKQTVPARYIVPDPVPLNSTSLLDAELSAGHHLDLSAHVVPPGGELSRDSPVLRVLFHTGADPRTPRHQQVCILVHASLGDRPALTAACSPDGEDGVCLAEITVPHSWWPPLPPPDPAGHPAKPIKTPLRSVKVSYSVLEPRGGTGAGSTDCLPRVQIQPVTSLASVPLTPARSAYRALHTSVEDALTMLLPMAPLFPRSRFHVPVFLTAKPGVPITGFVLRARVKSGLRVIGAEVSSRDSWNMSLDVNPKHTVATVTAFRRVGLTETDSSAADKRVLPRVEEVFSWLLEVVEDSADLWDEGRIVWTVRYVLEGQERRPHHARSSKDGAAEERKKITARLEIQKDDIQAVLPISKNWEVINTAVLTGRQVSQAMKVFIVSQAGKVADVTLQSSCHSEDESVLKVSSSCSSVYVDGSEIRGSWNASVLVKYGTYTGLARFTLWMPEFPLEISIADFRLSQIKSWRVPDEHLSRSTNKIKKRSVGVEESKVKWSASGINAMVSEDQDNGVDNDKHNICRLRYQQSPVEVFARFLAADHDSGRVSYLVSRRTWLRVTDLVLGLLRVSDPRIASLHGQLIQGRSIGRTEVQVLSAITGRVIGAKEVRVGNDRVSVTRLRVSVVSGLQLSITPDSAIDNGYVAETSVTRRLTAQYQEGLLDMEVEFTDGSTTPLRDISLSDYSLVVDSLSPDVVAFAPNALSQPRVIAVGEGRGELLRVALLTPEECRTGAAKRTPPLVSSTAQVVVDFASNMLQHRPDFVQNDGGANSGRDRKAHRETVDLHDILIGIPLKDENNHEPTVQARQHHGSSVGGTASRHGYQHTSAHMTPLEIGMYVLLAAFCFAIVVFVVSCVVYASKFKPNTMMVPHPDLPPEPPGMALDKSLGNSMLLRRPPPSPTPEPAHDWVWLGRATLERSSGMLVPAHSHAHAHAMRITSNPGFGTPDASLRGVVDSSTYCKDRPTHIPRHWNLSPTPPPLPPHGVLLEGGSIEGDYRPPVPPHRNMRMSPADMSMEQMRLTPSPNLADNFNLNMMPRERERDRRERGERAYGRAQGVGAVGGGGRRHHHHHHHHRNSANKGGRHRSNEPDIMLSAQGGELDAGEEGAAAFVELNANASPAEVKRATIVGNPMCMTEARGEDRGHLLALEDLNLGMDYHQIMEYFDNLKESNA